jgi:chromosome partitioning protein
MANTAITVDHVFESGEMDIIPSTNDLINYEFEFIKQSYPFDQLKNTLKTAVAAYDYVLIDCPPSAGYLTINALIASDAVLIPMQMDVLSLKGLEQMLDTIHEIKEEYNNELYVLGVLGVMVDARRQLTQQVLEHVRNEFGVSIFNNYIRQNVRAAEAPSHGMSVIDYAPKSNSAKDYISVTKELLTALS